MSDNRNMITLHSVLHWKSIGNVDLLKSLVGRIADSGMTVLIPSHVVLILKL